MKWRRGATTVDQPVKLQHPRDACGTQIIERSAGMVVRCC